MIRLNLAIAFALCLVSSPSYAQASRFIVTATSASIHQSPSGASRVIGQSPKGSVLDVRGELAGWIEISWSGAANGIAYVPASAGVIEKPAPVSVQTEPQRPLRPMTIDEYVHGISSPQAAASDSTNSYRLAPAQRPMTIDEYVHGASTGQTATASSAAGSPNPPAAYVAEAVAAVSATSTRRANMARPSRPSYVVPAHFVGFGGRIGNRTLNIGGTGRFWSRSPLGVQFEMFRDRMGNAAAERVSWLQFAPSVLYALPGAVNDYLWVRPYVGAGPTIDRATLRSADPSAVTASSKTSLGLELFGGGEMTFAGLPQFALSADLGYRKMSTAFAGFERPRMRVALSGHWFVR